MFFFYIFFFFFLRYSGYYFVSTGFILDGGSFLLCILTIWLAFFLFTYRTFYKVNYYFYYCLIGVLILCGLLIFSFMVSNLLAFYVFFEFSLLPLFYLIISWGYQVERITASYYLFIYTAVGSFPVFLRFLYFYYTSRIYWFILLFYRNTFERFKYFLVLSLVFGFFIKLPSYVLHLWLPKAHVEAPATGSMILAAILLKLRLYGLYRTLPLIFYINFNGFSSFIMSYLLWGSLLSSLLCILQVDLKSLIAYSSVRHMGLIIVGAFTFNDLAIWGVWLIAVAHGFNSRAIFLISGINYQSFFSRQIYILRGQTRNIPVVAFLWIMLLAANFSVPPFFRVVGESSILFSLFSIDFFLAAVIGFRMYLISYYCVYLISSVSQGRRFFTYTNFIIYDLFFLLRVFHTILLFVFIFKLNFIFFCFNSLIQNKELWFLK